MNVLPIAASTLAKAAGSGANPAVALFSQLLVSGIERLSANAGKGSPETLRAAGAPSPASRLEDRLAAKIQTLLDAGVSLGTIVAHLAGAIGAHFGGTDPQSRAAATNAVAQSLAPPGEPSPAGARALAGRLRSIAERLTGASDEQGQQQRSPGTILDAQTAKDSPAPTAMNATPNPGAFIPVANLENIPRTAVDSNHGAAPDPLAFVVEHANAYGSGERALRAAPAETAQAAGAGGTTLLGRILTRATNAALEREAKTTSAAATANEARVTAADGNRDAARLNSLSEALAPLLERFEAILANVPTPQATLPPDVRVTHRDADPVASVDAVTGVVASPGPSLVAAGTHEAAPAPPPVPIAPADPFHVVDQVIRSVNVRSLGSSSEIRLRLVPENLGDVTVKLVVHHGTVDATLLTQSAGARDALAGGQAQLTRALADAGLKLQGFTVDLGSNAFAGFPQHQQPGEHRSLPVRRISASSDAEDSGDPIEALSDAGTQDASPAPGALDTLV